MPRKSLGNEQLQFFGTLIPQEKFDILLIIDRTCLYPIGKHKLFRITNEKKGHHDNEEPSPWKGKSRKRGFIMEGPVISFDVSKGESHVRCFESSSRALGKVFRIAHDNVGYAKVEEAYETLKAKAGREHVRWCEREQRSLSSHSLLDSLFIVATDYPKY